MRCALPNGRASDTLFSKLAGARWPGRCLCVFDKQRLKVGTGQAGDDENLIVLGSESGRFVDSHPSCISGCDLQFTKCICEVRRKVAGIFSRRLFNNHLYRKLIFIQLEVELRIMGLFGAVPVVRQAIAE